MWPQAVEACLTCVHPELLSDLGPLIVRGWVVQVSDADLQYEWFFRAAFPVVLRTVSLILHDRGRSEDVTQEAFIQLLVHWRKVSRYERPEAWVRRVAIRQATRALGRERIWALLERGHPPISGRMFPMSTSPGLSDACR
jgi:Sigma-70 region 2